MPDFSKIPPLLPAHTLIDTGDANSVTPVWGSRIERCNRSQKHGVLPVRRTLKSLRGKKVDSPTTKEEEVKE
jgi:hypothetical protein